MKHLLFVFALLACFATQVQAQKIYRWGQVPYGKQAPASTNRPAESESQLWYNTTSSDLYRYDRTAKTWDSFATMDDVSSAYGEISISNDTSTISFAATTAAPLEELTAGLLNDFALVGDSALRYDGAAAARFLITYSTTVGFAEAANIITSYPVIGTTPILRTRSRQTVTLTTDKVQLNSSGIISLVPGQTVRLMFVPSAHTGTDVLSVYEANISLVQIH